MRIKFCIVVVLLLLLSSAIKAQEDYIFATQTDVDIFPIFCDPCDTVGRLTIRNDSRFISNLDSLESITTVLGGMSFSGPIDDIDLRGLHNVSTIRGAWFYQQFTILDTVTSWPQLSDVSDCELRLFDQSRVRYVLGFEGLDSLRSLVLDSEVLQEVVAFPDLEWLGRVRTFSGSLKRIEMSDQITTLNQLYLRNCDSLNEINFLPQLDSIGRLQIENTASLNGAFENTSIEKVSSLEVENQPAMQDLDWLVSLTFLEGVSLKSMPDLVSLEGIDVPVGLVRRIELVDNPLLSACQSDWLCHFLRDSTDYVISGNAPGCNSREEILAQCVFTDTDDQELASELTVYPNPTSEVLYIDYECSDCTYELVDAVGRVVQQSSLGDGKIDVHPLRPGVYHVMVYDDGDVYRSSVVIQ